ncbi:MAG: methyl-accepting chemotaxis protein [Elusimicrobia bacterium]|nr:methyl-accepting chemotaxis protein [Elusimicrobiota bacterium]
MTQPITSKVYKRRQYFIDKDFQSGFILKFLGVVAAGSGLTVILLYLFSLHSTTVAFVNARVTVMTTADFLVPILLQTMAVVTVLVSLGAAVVMVFVSHKIAGPLYRFKQTFRELGNGNFTNQVRLRKGDQLHEVASDFNQMITALRNQIHAIDAALTDVRSAMEAIGEYNVEDNKRKHFLELRQKVQELERAASFFKT